MPGLESLFLKNGKISSIVAFEYSWWESRRCVRPLRGSENLCIWCLPNLCKRKICSSCFPSSPRTTESKVFFRAFAWSLICSVRLGWILWSKHGWQLRRWSRWSCYNFIRLLERASDYVHPLLCACCEEWLWRRSLQPGQPAQPSCTDS